MTRNVVFFVLAMSTAAALVAPAASATITWVPCEPEKGILTNVPEACENAQAIEAGVERRLHEARCENGAVSGLCG